jgi:hypothetical protein
MTATNPILPEPELPPQPERPLNNDCCGGGCADCVFTLYARDLRRWVREVKEIRRRHAERLAALPNRHEEGCMPAENCERRDG